LSRKRLPLHLVADNRYRSGANEQQPAHIN
jgi:hypothetical protein